MGLCLSADLQRLHIKVHTDPEYHSYCAISEWANCETVAASDYAVFFHLPVALWGLLAYLVMWALAIWGLRRPLIPKSWPYGILFWLSAVSSMGSVVLYLVSHFIIESLCIVCMGVYLTNFLLLGCAFIEIRRLQLGPIQSILADIRSIPSRRVPLTVFGFFFVILLLTLWTTVPQYWQVEISKPTEHMDRGITNQGHPWIGAAKPKITIEEYSDYQCPHCRRGHDDIRKLISSYQDKVRLIHRHYPLDHSCNQMINRPFHPFACTYARMAFCAQEQNRFWEANDYLFLNGRNKEPITIDQIASSIGMDRIQFEKCMKSNDSKAAIQTDLESGRTLGIRGTPTFVVADRIYPGRIPNDVLAPILGGGQ